MKHLLKLSLVAALGIVSAVNANAKIINAYAPSLWGHYDKNGYAHVLDAPTKHNAYKVESIKNADGTYTINIDRGTSWAQSFKLEVTTDDVHFLDVNGDDYVDILVGPAASRTMSTVILSEGWGGHLVATEDEPSLNGQLIIGGERGSNEYNLISKGSGSYCSDYYRIYNWNNKKANVTETLIVISDPQVYKDYGVKCKYTVVKGDGNSDKLKKIKETNKLNKLPKKWQHIIESFDALNP